MCKMSIKCTIGAVLTGAAALFFGAGQIKADIAPGTCTPGSNGSDAVPQASSPGPFAIGQLMGYRVLLTNPTLDQFGSPGCLISNAFVNLRMPSGEVIPVLTNITLLPGEQIICPGAAQCLSTSRTGLVGAQLFYTNIITASQVTNVNLTQPQCPPAPGTNQAILAFTLGGAVVFNNAQPGIFGTATYNRCSTIPVNVPCIACSKNCSNATGQGGSITFSGFITNCGNSQLVNVLATNSVGGVLVPLTLASNTLNPGAFVPFSGSYTNPNPCVPVTDTILVRGTDPLLTTNATVTSQCTATCSNILTACIDITKTCDATEVPGGDVNFTVVVTNCGNVTLTNIVVVDRVPGVTTNTIFGPGTLAPGAFQTINSSYTVPANFCGRLTNTVTVTANDACGRAVGPDTASCVTEVPCPPQICVIKEVACAPVTDNIPANCVGLTYGESATGVVGGTNQTAFCYRIIVFNCGQDTLTNVLVVDPDLAGAGGVLPGFPTTLTIGQRVTNHFSKGDWGLGNHTNTVTVSGNGASTGTRVSTNDTARVTLVPASVDCRIVLLSSFDMDNNTNDNCVTLPDSSVVTFILTITNTGQVNLNVNVSGLPPFVDCTDQTNTVSLRLPIFVPVGGSVTTTNCFNATCPGGTNITVSVQGTVVASNNVPCIFDSAGNAITTAVSTCPACVRCVTPTVCRVTGGGQLIPGFVDQSCIEVATTIFPATSPNGLTINKITHGGQLGAPFAQMDCGAILGNPCIRGQWQHTRHYEGKANPRDVIDMDFHSQTPKGQYDSLSCACLGCCDPETGAFIASELGGLHPNGKYRLCNPDDHKVCGPQPRPSPANAIIWSGVGKVTPVDDVQGSRAAQAEWVIFRVYIEDRSEPGGGHPGGAVEPADIYCFQAWKTGIKVSKKPNFDDISPGFRMALGQANCDFLAGLEAGAQPIGTLPSPTVMGLTADIQDCGPMHDGNHQIHPATGAICD